MKSRSTNIGGAGGGINSLKARQLLLFASQQPEEQDPAFQLLMKSLDYLHLRVPATTCPELFVSMAVGPEVARCRELLETQGNTPDTISPPLDPTAVSVCVIHGLRDLKFPLISTDDASIMVNEFMRESTAHVRISVATHVMDRIPEPRRTALKKLLRYLRRLAAFSTSCNSVQLAQAVGPVLLRPESFQPGWSAGDLMMASIKVTKMLIDRYEVLFSDTLPDEKRQRALQDQIKRLILKKETLNQRNGSAGTNNSSLLRSSSAASSVISRQKSLPLGHPPTAIVDPIRTLPAPHPCENQQSEYPNTEPANIPSWLLEPWKPSGQLWRPPKLSTSVNNSAELYRANTPTRSMSGAGAAPSSVSGGGSSRHSVSSASLGGLQQQQQQRRSAEAAEMRKFSLPPTLLRQIELKAALKPPIEEQPHKEPWRPPGKNDRVINTKRTQKSTWTPAIIDTTAHASTSRPTSAATSTRKAGYPPLPTAHTLHQSAGYARIYHESQYHHQYNDPRDYSADSSSAGLPQQQYSVPWQHSGDGQQHEEELPVVGEQHYDDVFSMVDEHSHAESIEPASIMRQQQPRTSSPRKAAVVITTASPTKSSAMAHSRGDIPWEHAEDVVDERHYDAYDYGGYEGVVPADVSNNAPAARVGGHYSMAPGTSKVAGRYTGAGAAEASTSRVVKAGGNQRQGGGGLVAGRRAHQQGSGGDGLLAALPTTSSTTKSGTGSYGAAYAASRMAASTASSLKPQKQQGGGPAIANQNQGRHTPRESHASLTELAAMRRAAGLSRATGSAGARQHQGPSTAQQQPEQQQQQQTYDDTDVPTAGPTASSAGLRSSRSLDQHDAELVNVAGSLAAAAQFRGSVVDLLSQLQEEESNSVYGLGDTNAAGQQSDGAPGYYYPDGGVAVGEFTGPGGVSGGGEYRLLQADSRAGSLGADGSSSSRCNTPEIEGTAGYSPVLAGQVPLVSGGNYSAAAGGYAEQYAYYGTAGGSTSGSIDGRSTTPQLDGPPAAQADTTPPIFHSASSTLPLSNSNLSAFKGLYIEEKTGRIVRRKSDGEMAKESVYLPAGLNLEELLRAAEEVQGLIEQDEKKRGAEGEGQVGADSEYTPLDLAVLLAAHAKHSQRPHNEEARLVVAGTYQSTDESQGGGGLKDALRAALESRNAIAVATAASATKKKAAPPPPPPLPNKKSTNSPVPKAPETKKKAAPPPPPPLPPGSAKNDAAVTKKKAPPPPPPPPPGAAGKKKAAPPPPPPPPGGKKAPPPPPPPPGGAKKKGAPPPPPLPGAKKSDDKSKEDELKKKQEEEEKKEAVAPTAAQTRRLKQLHWDKLKVAGENTVWKKAKTNSQPTLDLQQLESLFQILENNTAKKVVGGGKANEEIRLVEHRRAHNICIELSGIRMPFADIKAALLALDDSALSVEQLTCLSRAVPDDQERKDLDLYLAGNHPRHRGVSDPEKLGMVERYFAEIKDIPRLAERISCLVFSRTYAGTTAMCRDQLDTVLSACRELRDCVSFLKLLQAVLELGNHLNQGTQRGSAAGFRLDTLLKLADVKGVDKKTSLLKFVTQQLLSEDASTANMNAELPHVKPAATMQLSAVSALVGEVRIGLRKVTAELEEQPVVSENDEDEISQKFVERMNAFCEQASAEFKELEVLEKSALYELRATTEYFGEEYQGSDPLRIVRVVRDFVLLFDKALSDIKEEEKKAAEAQRILQTTGASKHRRTESAPVVPKPASGGNKPKEAAAVPTTKVAAAEKPPQQPVPVPPPVAVNSVLPTVDPQEQQPTRPDSSESNSSGGLVATVKALTTSVFSMISSEEDANAVDQPDNVDDVASSKLAVERPATVGLAMLLGDGPKSPVVVSEGASPAVSEEVSVDSATPRVSQESSQGDVGESSHNGVEMKMTDLDNGTTTTVHVFASPA